MGIFIPTYFSPISQYMAIFKEDNIVFEVHDNFQKQTYRNRCYIYGANGKLSLNIPVKHLKSKERKKSKDTLVENDFLWQKQHLKSLQVAYRSSPFFEFFEDDLIELFEKKHKYLYDLNIDTFLFVENALELNKNYSLSKEYLDNHTQKDYRNLAIAKKGINPSVQPYTQMFDDKYGFINNLSILDLLFMEGSNAINFLS